MNNSRTAIGETSMQDDAPHAPPIYYDEVVQVNDPQIPEYPIYATETSKDTLPELNGSGNSLLDQFNECISAHISNVNTNQSSAFRNEVLETLRQRQLFQMKVMGDTIPVTEALNCLSFQNLNVSLILSISHTGFELSTVTGVVLINEKLTSDYPPAMRYISLGLLPPGLFDELRRMGLHWYDGGLLCEIEDIRSSNERLSKILLKVNPIDIAAMGSGFEEEFLFAKYPTLCLENDPQVGKLAAVVANDRYRLVERETTPTIEQYVKSRNPKMFLKKPKPPEPQPQPKPSYAELAKRVEAFLRDIK